MAVHLMAVGINGNYGSYFYLQPTVIFKAIYMEAGIKNENDFRLLLRAMWFKF